MHAQRFRIQLISLMGGVVVLLLVGIVGVMLYVAREHLFEVGASEGVVRAQAFALKAAFPVMVGREDNKEVQEFLAKVIENPQTLAAELVDLKGTSLGRTERDIGSLSACAFKTSDLGAGGRPFYFRKPQTWCTSVPVYAAPEDGTPVSTQRMIGRLRVISSQTSVVQVVRSLFIWGLSVGALMLGLALFLVERAARRLTKPLQDIVEVMRSARQGETEARATPHGPQEYAMIAAVYNDLMDRVAQQAAEQEAKVEERTRQLNAATQAAQLAEKSKSQWMRTAGHEMKTPLHVIAANARRVLGELEFIEGSATARKGLEVVLKKTNGLSRRVSQILALARAEAGSYTPVRERFELAGLAEDILEEAEPLAKNNGNALEVQVYEGVVYTDRDMLSQIVSNLVTNACKYTNNGMVRVRLARSIDELHVEVIDTGRGIPASQQATVWKEFMQVDMGEGRRVGGFGLGLAIVKRFTEALGGSVELSSEEGRGTRVTVRLAGAIVDVDQ